MRSKPIVLWIMGPTSSGKTTIARRLRESWPGSMPAVMHFDGDEVREMFGENLGFGAQDRLRVVKSLVHFANKCVDSGVDAIVSALTANSDAREYVRAHTKNLVVCFLRCSIEGCAERDPKGLYEKAKSGEIQSLIGFNTPYVDPDSFDICIDTERHGLDDAVDRVLEHLSALGAE